ncbi:MAG: Eco57I restriction-modification methylase domain-containing protein, partial [Verrucomicrobia bacterium]|nr:Eco57I restriction-modification methylase domain-containing protein [Verrucomicrobiota bacterium]
AAAKREFYNAESVPEKRRLRFAIYEATGELAQIELTVARNELGLIPDPANAEKVAELDHAQKEMGAVLAEIRAARKLKAADQDDALERLRARFDDPKKPTFVWQLDFAEVFHRFVVPALAGSAPEKSNALELVNAGPAKAGTTNLSGFDLLVGNPPYVRIQVLNQSAPAQVAWFKTHYDAAKKGNYDLYVVFVERSLQLLQPRGQLAFILPHKFFNAQYGEPLRELLAKGQHLRHVVHFGDQQIFPGATNYVCLLFLAKAGADECRWVRADNLPDWLATLRAPETALPAARLTAAEWNFAVGQSSGLFDKLQGMPVKLGDVADRMFQGPITSADTVYLFKEFKRTKDGLTEVFSKELDKPIQVETGILKRVVRSGQVGRYFARPTALVLFPYEVRNNEARIYTPAEMRKTFPLAWEYLSKNRRLLEDREKGAFKDNEWYRFGRTQNLGMWEQPKLLVPYMITELGAYADHDESFYFINVTTGGYGITTPGTRGSLAYLCALLNSRLLDFFLKRISTNFHGGYFAANKQFIEQLPIRPIDFASASERAEHAALAGLVERILSAKRLPVPARQTGADSLADTSALEREIDQRVYRLYALTPDEIKLVEEAAK